MLPRRFCGRAPAQLGRPLRALALACALVWPALAPARSVGDSLTQTEKRDLSAEARLVIELLQNLQYSDRQFRDIDGAEIVTRYLKALDPEFLVFTQGDVEFIHRRYDRSIKAAYLLKGNLQPAFEIFDDFVERAKQRLNWADARLGSDLKLDEPGTFVAATEPPVDGAEADRRWLLRLKHAVVTEIVSGRDPTEAIDHVRKNYRKWSREIDSMDALAVREHFFDGLIGLFDPHSGYFSAEHAHEFQIMMQGAVAGVGLGVRMDDGHCLVQEVTPGGPAELAGAFRVGDELVALSDDGKTWRNLADLPLQQIVTSLRGAVGTKLSVAVKTTGGPRREASLARAQVVLAGDRARGAIVEVPGSDGTKHDVGWIDLPDFYASESGVEGASAAKDVRELIDRMKRRGIEAIVLDLRENPGGAMSEAVALSGLFLPDGVVTLLRGLDGKVQEQKIEPAPVAFAGPLVVLTSSRSASASEMFAGAMAFHRRAVVVGEASTFGKGTAQDYIDLNKLPVHADAKLEWGTLRVTRGRFYFPDGQSPQRRGAPSDIVLPLAGEPGHEREADLPHALPEETIPVPDAKPAVAEVARVDAALLKRLHENAAGRASSWLEYAFIHRYEAINPALAQKDAPVSVQLEPCRQEQREREAKLSVLVQEVRAWLVNEAYATERVEIAAVSQADDAHVKLVRARKPKGASAKLGWMQAGTFYRENSAGKLQEVALSQVHYVRYLGDAAELAAVFHAASGMPATAGGMVSVLRRLSLLEEPTDRQIVDCFARLAASPENVERLAVWRGTDAVFQRLAVLDPGLLDPARRLDVAQREALRLAVDWAEVAGAAPAGVAKSVADPKKP